MKLKRGFISFMPSCQEMDRTFSESTSAQMKQLLKESKLILYPLILFVIAQLLAQ